MLVNRRVVAGSRYAPHLNISRTYNCLGQIQERQNGENFNCIILWSINMRKTNCSLTLNVIKRLEFSYVCCLSSNKLHVQEVKYIRKPELLGGIFKIEASKIRKIEIRPRVRTKNLVYIVNKQKWYHNKNFSP